jgi:hypothetical protein
MLLLLLLVAVVITVVVSTTTTTTTTTTFVFCLGSLGLPTLLGLSWSADSPFASG